MAQAATTAGALKQYIESKGLGVAVERDAPPEDPQVTTFKRPYITVQEDISITPDSDEDGGAANSAGGGESYVTELAQVDLWMDWREKVAGDGLRESRTLARALHRALAGAALDQAPTRVYNVKVQNRIRLVERENNLVHVAFTLAIRRVL